MTNNTPPISEKLTATERRRRERRADKAKLQRVVREHRDPNRHQRRSTDAQAGRAKPNAGESIDHKLKRIRAQHERIQAEKAARSTAKAEAAPKPLTRAEERKRAAYARKIAARKARHAKYRAKNVV